MKAEIEYLEKGSNNIRKTYYNGKTITEEFLINFFGLEGDDIVWYNITIKN